MSDQGKFHKLYLSILDAHPNITKQQCQKDTNDVQQQIKRKEKIYDEVMAQLQMRAHEQELKMMKFWTGNNDDFFMSKYVKSHFNPVAPKYSSS